MDGHEQTQAGRSFERHPHLLRGLALVALVWGFGYLTWRIGWSGQCYVVCSQERLRGHRPSTPIPETETIVVSLDEQREGVPNAGQAALPATAQ